MIEAYEMNGVQVPEQHLNDTEVLPIDEELSYKAGEEIELGLMQGFLTLPFPCNAPDSLMFISYSDSDPRTNYVINYLGETPRLQP